MSSPATCKQDKCCLASSRAPSTEGDPAGLPQGKGLPWGEGLPDVHREHGRGKDKAARLERAKQQLPRQEGEEKKLPRPREGDAERRARAGGGGSWART